MPVYSALAHAVGCRRLDSFSITMARSIACSASTNPFTSSTSTRKYRAGGSALLASRWTSELALPTNRIRFPDSI
jgi:hypothetical protein